MGTQYIEDPQTGKTIPFEWEGESPPTENDLNALLISARGQKVSSPAIDNTPAWAAQYPNLYGLYGAGRALLRTGIEAAGTTAGAAGGALLPVPGSSLLGAGAGYAGAKRGADWLMGETPDMSAGGIAQDVALGGLMQGGGNLIGKIPFVNKILSPSVADVGPAVGSYPLEKAGEKLMEKAVKIPPSVPSNIREKTLNAMLEGGITVSKRSLQATKEVIGNLNTQIDDVIANSPNKASLIDKKATLGPVMELRATLNNIAGGDDFVKGLDNVVAKYLEKGGDFLTVAEAQKIKQATNKVLAGSYGQMEAVQTEARKQIVRGLKDKIAENIPEIAGLNLQYGQAKMVEKALERAVNRTGNTDLLGLIPAVVGTAASAGTGSIATAAKAATIAQIVKAPYVQSRLAIALYSSGVPKARANAMANVIINATYNSMVGGYE